MADNPDLQRQYDALVARSQALESDVLIQKKRVELIETRLTEEKEAEIASLNAQFAEVLEKRKEAFMQVKEKLQQASAVITKFQNQRAADVKQIEDLTNELSSMRQSAGSQNSEVDRSLQRISDLETQLMNERSTVATLNTSNSELQAEIQGLKTKLENFEDKGTRPKSSITLDDIAGAPPSLLPGLLENSRTVTFKWALAGPMRIQWYRSFRGSQWETIPGKLANRPQYSITVDDIGATLKAEATHTGTGQQVFAETGPIQCSMHMIGAVSEATRKLDFTINCESALQEAKKDRQIQMNKEKIKVRQGGKTTHKANWSDQVRIVLDGDSSNKFHLHIDAKTEAFQLVCANSRERDFFVHIIRSFVFQVLRGKSITYSDHLQALALQARVLNELHKAGPVTSAAAAKKTSAPATPKSTSAGGKPAGPANGRTTSIGSKNDLNVAAATKPAPGTPSNGAATQNGNAVEDDGFAMFGLAPAPSGPSTPARKASVSSTAKESTPASAAPAAVKSAEGEGNEEGFTVKKNRGFDDYAPKGDDGFDSSDDEPDNRQAIKVTINAEARPIADAASLQKFSSTLQLTGKSKKGKKGEKGAKKKRGDGNESTDFSFAPSHVAASGAGASPSSAADSSVPAAAAPAVESMDDLLDLFGAPRKQSDPVVSL